MNKMKEIAIEKVVLSISATAENLEKGKLLLERITEKKAAKRTTRKRIPTLGVRPGLEIGVIVTLRGKKAIEILKRLISVVDNKIKEKQISGNSFSFGIKEYIEIPGMKYQRDIGIMGFDVSVAFSRKGKRVEERKIRRAKMPKKQRISKEEILEYLNKIGINRREK